MKGSLPPNSKINLCSFWLAIPATIFPALVLPVIVLFLHFPWYWAAYMALVYLLYALLYSWRLNRAYQRMILPKIRQKLSESFAAYTNHYETVLGDITLLSYRDSIDPSTLVLLKWRLFEIDAERFWIQEIDVEKDLIRRATAEMKRAYWMAQHHAEAFELALCGHHDEDEVFARIHAQHQSNQDEYAEAQADAESEAEADADETETRSLH